MPQGLCTLDHLEWLRYIYLEFPAVVFGVCTLAIVVGFGCRKHFGTLDGTIFLRSMYLKSSTSSSMLGRGLKGTAYALALGCVSCTGRPEISFIIFGYYIDLVQCDINASSPVD